MNSGLPLRPDLSVVAIVADPEALELLRRTCQNSEDRLSIGTNLSDGLARVSVQAPDVVFVDVTLGEGAGLAMLHHIHALAPAVTAYAITTPDQLELGTQAAALGSAGTLVLPLSGDELITALSQVRTRHGERAARLRLEREVATIERHTAIVQEVAEVAEARTRRDAAARLAEVLVAAGLASSAVVYIPAAEGSRQLLRAANCADATGAPSFCDEMELLLHARAHDLFVLRLSSRREHSGLVLLGGTPDSEASGKGSGLLGLVALQATTALALVGLREQSQRGAMKDPSSSTYTFAYFVDVAGREIDVARRHGRRFSLATVAIQYRDAAETAEAEPTEVVAEQVLAAVRDTDVLARVDANEFYLLLPETGGIGAHACRRRVLSYLTRGADTRQARLAFSVGVATFPHDGEDLSRLLRVAKHRAEASLNSAVHRLQLDALPLSELCDRLLAQTHGPTSANARGLEFPHYIELPAMDLVGLALGVLSEAVRGGQARVLASSHAGLSVGGAVRAEYGRDSEGLRFDSVDVDDLPSCANLEVLTVIAEHATYALLGRIEGSVVRAIHAADPLLVDVIAQKLAAAAQIRLAD